MHTITHNKSISENQKGMSSSTGLLRLRKEFKELQKKPVDNIRAAPKESNILEWHYTIEGAKSIHYP